jgi:hypothetical protein
MIVFVALINTLVEAINGKEIHDIFLLEMPGCQSSVKNWWENGSL